MMKSKNALRAAAVLTLALGATACATGASSGGGDTGGRYVEAFDPTGSALAAAFRRPTREGDAEAALAEHVRTPAFLQQYAATRQKAGCPDTGSCTHRLILVQVDGRGRPLGETPTCAEINAQLDRDARGQVAVRGITWVRRAAPCAA
ncbi:hypothetical protein [Vineibacter terrae]|uniref:hypothetical protein n=1 Tax=Vineibacter terrae TaxID=2586908 RepID=UPI002E37C26C|nr:hypothetical protein [Vineibacter terrae]HEX2885785.1 hypothetical protein [Vineibacter terrae]